MMSYYQKIIKYPHFTTKFNADYILFETIFENLLPKEAENILHLQNHSQKGNLLSIGYSHRFIAPKDK